MSLMFPLAAALVFACENPTHHDGDAMRCAGQEQALRLFGIDAPEMPGSCRPGRKCTAGDPYESQNYLANLTAGRSVRCEEKDIDRYGRVVARCVADEVDISCAMVAAGQAVERYGALNCGQGLQVATLEPSTTYSEPEPEQQREAQAEPPPEPQRAEDSERYFARSEMVSDEFLPSWPLLAAILLAAVNILGFLAMMHDRKRARSRRFAPRYNKRVPDSQLLLIAAAGGGVGVLAVQLLHGHKAGDAAFSRNLLLITGLWIGVVAGALLLQVV